MKYTKEEDDFIIHNYNSMTKMELCSKLGRSYSSMVDRIRTLRTKGLVSKKYNRRRSKSKDVKKYMRDYQRKYAQKPEVKARLQAYEKVRYDLVPGVKERKSKYAKERKEYLKKYHALYDKLPKVKERRIARRETKREEMKTLSADIPRGKCRLRININPNLYVVVTIPREISYDYIYELVEVLRDLSISETFK